MTAAPALPLVVIEEKLRGDAELAGVLADAGLSAHASLPDACYPFKGSLSSYHSDLSEWSRRVRQLGLLD